MLLLKLNFQFKLYFIFFGYKRFKGKRFSKVFLVLFFFCFFALLSFSYMNDIFDDEIVVVVFCVSNIKHKHNNNKIPRNFSLSLSLYWTTRQQHQYQHQLYAIVSNNIIIIIIAIIIAVVAVLVVVVVAVIIIIAITTASTTDLRQRRRRHIIPSNIFYPILSHHLVLVHTYTQTLTISFITSLFLIHRSILVFSSSPLPPPLYNNIW